LTDFFYSSSYTFKQICLQECYIIGIMKKDKNVYYIYYVICVIKKI